MNELKDHWNKIYDSTVEDKLGWFESDFKVMWDFMDLIADRQGATVFIAGAGLSRFVEALLEKGMKLVINDLSSIAIEKMKARLEEKSKQIEWICQDVSKSLPIAPGSIDIWIDRAVLHFLNDSQQIESYFANVQQVVRQGGHAIFSEFSKKGAKKCAGLAVKRYDSEDLQFRLPDFDLIDSTESIYEMPNGAHRPYIHTLFKRQN